MVRDIVTYSDIILYWDYTDRKTKDEKYYVYLDGELKNETEKTHTTLRQITAKEVKVEIYTDSQRQDLFYENHFTMSVKPPMIDITASPYKAVGDGKTLNTVALQQAIDDCPKQACVYIPKGVYLTGSLNLHSNMELYLEEGAVLQGTENPEDYLPKIWTRYEGTEMECYRALINLGNIQDRDAIACENVLIHGGGKICGGGRPLSDRVIAIEEVRLKDYIDSLSDEDIQSVQAWGICARSRPKLINISCAKNVIMDNIHFSNGACWNIHMLYSQDIVTCNCSLYSHGVNNGDGWDPDSSTNCTLFNIDFDTGDDCVAIKSGKNPEGNQIAKPCREIRVFDCRSEDGHGISMGSEMSGGISDVYIWDCIITQSQIGCNIKATKKRGGYIKNIHFNHCSFARLNIGSVGYNDDGEAAPTPPVFSGLYFEDVTFRGEALLYDKKEMRKATTAINIAGFDDQYKISNVVLKDVVIDNGYSSDRQMIGLQMVENLSIINLRVR